MLDPYRPGALGGRIALDLPDVRPFAVLSTHRHEDHGWRAAGWGGVPFVEGPWRADGVEVRAAALAHDACAGARMGYSKALRLDFDPSRGGPLSLVHVGDAGVADDDGLLALCEGADVLLVPAGGTYTLDGGAALTLIEAVAPHLADLASVRASTGRRVQEVPSGELNLTTLRPPPGTEILWLAPTAPALSKGGDAR